MSRAFWLIVFVAGAISTHLGYVLFAPNWQMGRILDAAAAFQGSNSLGVLPAEADQAILGGDGVSGVAAICVIDLSRGPVKLSAKFPEDFWTLTLYGADGKIVSSFAEAQAGLRDFELTLMPPAGLSAVLGTPGGKAAIPSAWTVTMTSQRGLAVLWASLPQPHQRARIAAVLGASRCVGT